MISSFELKRDTWKVIGEKLDRGDAVLEALDRVMWREAVKIMAKELKEVS